MSKLCSCSCAVESIDDGSSVMIGGFMGGGSPHRLIDELVRQGKKDLTIIANDTARPGIGIGKLIDAGAVKRLIASHIGLNPETQKRMIANEIEVELVPQGTLAERIRAGGTGLGGVLTATGVGTVVAEGKQTVEIEGEDYLVETPLKADFALIHALRSDMFGNLQYLLTSRNFNPSMALAGETVIAEASEVVPVGMIPPDHVETVGVLVDHLVSWEA
ncbi:acetate CoA/acetoacetate CoA-transferase alpha subunit [Rhodopseudomonas julia]|uniref:Acetate CoA/acetoacetate CoA-transferase alpha subunit n=1 Tax=Rhodopseudomonas julia TaxID=200617 RepID=A0ABU0C445_9BRAD|nr:3-oxoacid CoA-transferase subunit A [Rhodopseudomonas julia]MDQ0324711.1 acetate CoA/acetoacetate CoA-transferase alpha subunit [Rhodopseudomonas julia]